MEGTCYICGFTNARSDQCDRCGNLLDPAQLIDPRSKIDGTVPELRETEHFYLDLAKLQPGIVEFLRQRESYWRPNVLRQSLGQIEAEGLHGRPITRDLDWGIPVPVEGWNGKCLYVWFEAVIGYLSAAIEWGQVTGEPTSLAKTGGRTRMLALSISSAKITSPSMPSSGRRSSSARGLSSASWPAQPAKHR